MRTRPLKWDDLKVEISTVLDHKASKCPNWVYVPWVNRAGETRVHASLIGCSFVNKIFWLKNFDLQDPATQASILLQIQQLLRRTVHKLKTYEKL